MAKPIEERIARYDAWRLREAVDRPMFALVWEPDVAPLPELFEHIRPGSEFPPDRLQPQVFLSHIERCYRQDLELASDGIQRFTPAFSIPWVEAIAGCPVMAEPGSFWAESFLESLVDRPPIRFDPDNPWLRKLVEFTRAIVDFADGRFPVAAPQLRGPLDTLSAMRTPQQMCVDLVDQSEEVSRLLGELADLWIGIGRAVLEVIPPFHGGYCARMGMFAPGPALTPQNDCSTLISPGLYEEMVLPWDEKIVANFPFTEFHMHASQYHQVDNLLKLDGLTAIQFTLEHTIGGPPLETVFPVLRRILGQKPLLLAAADLETPSQCLEQLPHQGLLMTVATSQCPIPRKIAKWLEEHCR